MKNVEIYPSSWYYNASVHGFLEVLAWGLGDQGQKIVEEQFLQNDGSVLIPGDLMEAVFSTDDVPAPNPKEYMLKEVPDGVKDLKRIAWWWVEKTTEVYFTGDRKDSWSNTEKVNKILGKVFYKDGRYPNFINLGTYITLESRCEQLNRYLSYIKTKGGYYHCSFCNAKFDIKDNATEYESALTRSISLIIGNAPNRRPNRFWNLVPNRIFCPQCQTYLLFNHLNLNKDKQAFINTDSLKLNWYLNKLIYTGTPNNSKPFLEAFQALPMLQQSITAWGLQNLELFTFALEGEGKNKFPRVKHMPISGKAAELLIQPNISSYLNKLPSRPVWELFSEEQFSYFPTLIVKNLAVLVKGKTIDQEKKDPEVFVEPKEDKKIQLLINFYAAVLIALKSGEGDKHMVGLNLEKIRKVAQEAPLNLAANRGLVFRLLELTKLGERADVYHLLLRYYTAQKVIFPEVLSDMLLLEDKEMFQTGVYAYISYLPTGEK